MNITFFIRSKKSAISIDKHFSLLISEIGKSECVEKYYMPEECFSLHSVLKNLKFTFKHRNKSGINHVTGDCHYIILALIGCKTVLTIHDLGFYVSHKKEMSLLKRYLLYILQIYLPIKIADRVIAITEKTKEEILETIPFKKDIQVARHISIDEFPFVPKKLDTDNVLIFQSGTAKNKNLDTTMKAVSELGLKMRILREMKEYQKELAVSLNLNYTNIYNITDKQVTEEYINSDIVCMPSLYEGFGAMVIEAQAVGRPVITTNLEPMRSVSGGAAYLLEDPQNVEEMKQAIIKIIKDEKYRNELINKGRKNASKYTLMNCAKEHISIYKTFK